MGDCVIVVGVQIIDLLLLQQDAAVHRSARELRGKSYEDLHRLWYVLVTERNMLLTEKHLAKTNREPMRAPQRMTKVRKSMARIKHVLTERAIEEAGGDEKKLFEMMRLINAK